MRGDESHGDTGSRAPADLSPAGSKGEPKSSSPVDRRSAADIASDDRAEFTQNWPLSISFNRATWRSTESSRSSLHSSTSGWSRSPTGSSSESTDPESPTLGELIGALCSTSPILAWTRSASSYTALRGDELASADASGADFSPTSLVTRPRRYASGSSSSSSSSTELSSIERAGGTLGGGANGLRGVSPSPDEEAACTPSTSDFSDSGLPPMSSRLSSCFTGSPPPPASGPPAPSGSARLPTRKSEAAMPLLVPDTGRSTLASSMLSVSLR